MNIEKSSKRLGLRIEPPQDPPVEVELRNSNNEIVFSSIATEVIELNQDKLSVGDYLLLVKSPTEIVGKALLIREVNKLLHISHMNGVNASNLIKKEEPIKPIELPAPPAPVALITESTEIKAHKAESAVETAANAGVTVNINNLSNPKPSTNKPTSTTQKEKEEKDMATKPTKTNELEDMKQMLAEMIERSNKDREENKKALEHMYKERLAEREANERKIAALTAATASTPPQNPPPPTPATPTTTGTSGTPPAGTGGTGGTGGPSGPTGGGTSAGTGGSTPPNGVRVGWLLLAVALALIVGGIICYKKSIYPFDNKIAASTPAAAATTPETNSVLNALQAQVAELANQLKAAKAAPTNPSPATSIAATAPAATATASSTCPAQAEAIPAVVGEASTVSFTNRSTTVSVTNTVETIKTLPAATSKLPPIAMVSPYPTLSVSGSNHIVTIVINSTNVNNTIGNQNHYPPGQPLGMAAPQSTQPLAAADVAPQQTMECHVPDQSHQGMQNIDWTPTLQPNVTYVYHVGTDYQFQPNIDPRYTCHEVLVQGRWQDARCVDPRYVSIRDHRFYARQNCGPQSPRMHANVRLGVRF